MVTLKMVLAVCATAATIAFWAVTRQDGAALSALLAFLGGLAIGSKFAEKSEPKNA